MGAWGGGVFANDDASDWAGDLVDGGSVQHVQNALSVAAECPGDGYLEAPEGSEALAAAGVVAAARGRPLPDDSCSDAVLEWAAEHPEIATAKWLALALRAVNRVMAPASELRELWLDDEGADPDAAREWTHVLAELRSRLGD